MKIKLRELLDDKDISLLKFSKRVGVCYRTLNLWTLGRTKNISAEVADKVCYALGCSIGDLLEAETPADTTKIKKLYR